LSLRAKSLLLIGEEGGEICLNSLLADCKNGPFEVLDERLFEWDDEYICVAFLNRLTNDLQLS